MYLTHSFIAIQQGHLNYLLFYITEEYIENQEKLRRQLNPLLEALGRSLGDKGAVVKAFDSEIAVANKELSERFDQEFTRDIIISIEDRMEKPGLLILNSDIKSFDTKKNSWLYISFREYLDDFGNLKIYNVQELFDTIKNAIVKEENLFDKARQHLRKEKAISAHKIVELKPGAFGISLDLKETFNFFKQLRDK
ncbi:MAG: hypothetical protein WD512_12510 [Candidatus Paceibacterota bacterium]